MQKVQTKRLYKYVNILEYHDGAYVLTNPISEKNIVEMRNNMDDADVVEFDKFLKKNWGIKMKSYAEIYDDNEVIAEDIDDLKRMADESKKTSKKKE